MPRNCPTPTLFPYTTLFRSQQVDARLHRVLAIQPGDVRLVFGRVLRVHVVRDRKSTRLNSSHQIISYAVFCLKKKNSAAPIKNAMVIAPPVGSRCSSRSASG